MSFLSEIHYKNSLERSSGIDEYVEVTISPSDLARVADFQVVTYQRDGTVREILNVADYTPQLDPATGWFVFEMPTLITDPNNDVRDDEAEAVAFIDNAAANPVQLFVDIGGGTRDILAIEGPAMGQTSTNIPPSQGQRSIQFDAFGNRVDGPISQGSSTVCLTAGTMIETSEGPRPIESLQEGDLIRTANNGLQPLRAVFHRRIFGVDYRLDRSLWPVRITKGSLGFGLPERDMWVSQQHRMVISNVRFSLLFDEPQVFVRAKSLVASFPGVTVDSDLTEVTYYHLIFDQHEVIFAEGAQTESFHPGREAVCALDGPTRQELFRIFPALRVGEKRREADYQTIRSWELMAAVA